MFARTDTNRRRSRRRRRRRWRARAGVVAASVALVACGPSGGPAGPTTTALPAGPIGPTTGGRGPRVYLIGDSMADEARPQLLADGKAAGLDLTVIAEGKAGPCDQLGTVLRALARRPPVVAVEWIGNTLFTSPCSKAFQPAAVRAEHLRALRAIAAARRPGTTVLIVGIPPVDVKPWIASRGALEPLFRAWPATHPGFAYVDTTPSVAPAGKYVVTLPCRPADVAAKACGAFGAPPGRVVVRDPIGLHFCPVRYDNDHADCPVWNSGAQRYAAAIVAELVALTR